MKSYYRHNINNLIALCHVVEDFEDFYIKYKYAQRHFTGNYSHYLNIISSGKKF